MRQVGCCESLKSQVVSRFGPVIVNELRLTRSIFWLKLLLEGSSAEHWNSDMRSRTESEARNGGIVVR